MTVSEIARLPTFTPTLHVIPELRFPIDHHSLDRSPAQLAADAAIWFSAFSKLAHPPQLDEGFAHLGIPLTQAFGLGVLELSCAVIYLVPRTSVLGAILLTGYLGGAIQTHLRVGDPWVVQAILGVVVWAGLTLREPKLRALIPLKS